MSTKFTIGQLKLHLELKSNNEDRRLHLLLNYVRTSQILGAEQEPYRRTPVVGNLQSRQHGYCWDW